MIRFIVLLLFVGFLALTPVYLLDTAVMPQLFSLKDLYSSADATAAKASGVTTNSVDSATAGSKTLIDSH